MACKRLSSRGDEEKARMNENKGWVGGGRGRLFTTPRFSNQRSSDFFVGGKKIAWSQVTLFRRGFLRILVDQREQKGITPEIIIPVVWDSLFLWEGEIMAFKFREILNTSKNQLKYDKTSRIKSNPSERKWWFSLLTSMYCGKMRTIWWRKNLSVDITRKCRSKRIQRI